MNSEEELDPILESLPLNARPLYVTRCKSNIEDLVSKVTISERIWRTINLLRLYPLLCNFRYLNNNNIACVIVNGEHRLYRGPCYLYVTGITDRIVKIVTIGEDIDFGPLKGKRYLSVSSKIYLPLLISLTLFLKFTKVVFVTRNIEVCNVSRHWQATSSWIRNAFLE